jgi:tRNA (Thr-GGU) A37 N-methylase
MSFDYTLNPIGIKRVRVLEIEGTRLKVGSLEAVDGRPVVDIRSAMTRKLDA